MQSAVPVQSRVATYTQTTPSSSLQLLDRTLALVTLLGAAPVIAAAALVVVCLTRRSPFILHRRVGRFSRPFHVIKIRTMWSEEDLEVPENKIAGDPRVTSGFARFCRKYSIDEFPQLLQVVVGQMSLVGPRPVTRGEMTRYYGESEAEVTSIRPGLTGLWQVRGRNQCGYRRRRRLDVFLVRRYSAALYFRILLETVRAVATGRNAW